MTHYGHVIYCEDIRQEQDNQFTLVGCFKGNVNVAQFPAMLPKVGISLTWLQTKDEPLIPITMKVLYRPENPDDEVVVFKEESLPIDQIPGIQPEGDFFVVHAQMTMFALNVGQPGTFGVRLYRDGEEMRLPGLKFAHVPADGG